MKRIYINSSGADASATVLAYYRRAALRAVARWDRSYPKTSITLPPPPPREGGSGSQQEAV